VQRSDFIGFEFSTELSTYFVDIFSALGISVTIARL
jgi:hypothetical protein